MATKDDVLDYLRKNSEVSLSGEEIAKNLGVSRAAVWKAIKSLRDDGYSITAATNRGYMLLGDNDFLSAGQITSMLNGKAKEYRVTVFDRIDSTNLYLKGEAAKGAKDGTVAIAASQSKGRGRLGRRFISDKGGLYMSLLIRPDMSAEKSLFITTAAAVAVCRAIEKESSLTAGIKWVNDIFINGKKVCGILTEGASDFESGRLEYAVVGIGINVEEPKGSFDSEIAGIAVSLYGKHSPDNAKNRLAAAVLNELAKVLSEPDNKNTADEYRRRSVVIGKRVNINSENGIISATVEDIDDDAAIILKTDDGKLLRKTSGEISIRSNMI